MSIRKAFVPSVTFLLSLVALGACSSEADSEPEAANCTVTQAGDQVTITCGDDEVVLDNVGAGPGAGGASAAPTCSLSESTAEITLTCGDEVTSFTKPTSISFGGAGGGSLHLCSLAVSGDDVILTCGEESVVIPSPAEASGACTITETVPGYSTIDCPDGSSVSIVTCAGEPASCEDDESALICGDHGWETIACPYGCITNEADEIVCRLYGAGGAGGMGGTSG